jgi:hypothetical protein
VLNEPNEATRIHPENDPPPTPLCNALHAASQSLYDVALGVIEINELVQAELNPSSKAALRFDVLVAFAKLALDRAEGAR